MPKTVMMSLKQPAAILVYRVGELVPALADIYDYRPYLQSILQEIFQGYTSTCTIDPVQLLELDLPDRESALAVSAEVSKTVFDIVSGYLPMLLTDGNIGFTYMIVNGTDLEVTIPDRFLLEPAQTVAAFDFVENIKESVDNGDYVPPNLRRLIGC